MKLCFFLVLLALILGEAKAQNLFHFGVRLEVSVTDQRPQWQTALLGFQAGMAFKIANAAVVGFRFSGTGNPETLKFRFAADVFAYALIPQAKGFVYGGLGYARSQVVAASFWDIHALAGVQLPLGVFVEATLGLAFTDAISFATFPPKIVPLGPFLTFGLVFGIAIR